MTPWSCACPPTRPRHEQARNPCRTQLPRQRRTSSGYAPRAGPGTPRDDNKRLISLFGRHTVKCARQCLSAKAFLDRDKRSLLVPGNLWIMSHIPFISNRVSSQVQLAEVIRYSASFPVFLSLQLHSTIHIKEITAPNVLWP